MLSVESESFFPVWWGRRILWQTAAHTRKGKPRGEDGDDDDKSEIFVERIVGENEHCCTVKKIKFVIFVLLRRKNHHIENRHKNINNLV